MSIQIGTFNTTNASIIKKQLHGLGAPAEYTTVFIQPTSMVITDLSPNHHTLSSDCTFIQNPIWDGKYVFQASGSNRYIDGPTNNSTFNLGSGNFTLEAVFQPIGNNAGDYGRILGTEDSNKDGWSFELPPGGGFPNAVRLERNTNDVVVQPSFPFIVNELYHVAITRNGNTFRTFVNGTQIGTTTSTTTFPYYGKFRCLSRSDMYRRAIRANFYSMRVVKGVSLYNANFNADLSQPMYLY